MDELKKVDRRLFNALKPAKRKHGVDKIWMFYAAANDELFTSQHGASALSLQSYSQWRSFYQFQKIKHRTRLAQRTIYLLPLLYQYENNRSHSLVNSKELLKLLEDFCTVFFLGTKVVVSSPLEIQRNDFTARVHSVTNRLQFLVTDILEHIERGRPRDAYCVAAITNADLYPSPEWNFVLGHASLTSGCGVFSFGREIDDNVEQSDWPKYIWRLFKVMTHEICHMFGLQHCYYFECALNESNSIVQAEEQPLFLCPVCLRKLHKVLKFDVAKRYRLMHQKLLDAYSIVKLQEAPKVLDTVMEKPAERLLPGNPESQATFNSVVSSSPGGTHLKVAQPVKTEAAQLHQQEKFINAIEWLKKCIHSISNITHTVTETQ